MAPYYADGQWGYANRAGEVVIAVQYDTVGFFELGLHRGEGKYAIVGKAGKFGVIDTRGEPLLPIQQDYVLPYAHYQTKGLFGEYRHNGRTYYFSAKRKQLRRLPGKKMFICGNGLDSKCITFTYRGPHRSPDTPHWQTRTMGVRQGNRTVLPEGIDSIYYGRLGRTLLFADERVAVAGQQVFHGDSLRRPITFDYDRVGFFPCGFGSQSAYSVIKVRADERWGLLDLNAPKRNDQGQFYGVTPKYLAIQLRHGDHYRVEYAPGRYGWVFYNLMGFVEYW